MLSMPTPAPATGEPNSIAAGMLAGPVMRPGKPAFDQPLVDRIQGLLNTDHGGPQAEPRS